MAALDVLQAARSTGDSTAPAVTFSAVSAGDLLVFFVGIRAGDRTVTPPGGLTAYTSRAGWPLLKTYARVVQGGDSSTWTFSLDSSSEWVVVGYRVEGTFTDLTGVTIDDDAAISASTSRKIRTSDVSVAANTLVIAGVTVYANDTFSFDNSFANTTNDASGPFIGLGTARRLYGSSSSTVASTATWTTSTDGAAALARIAAPSGGGSTVAKSVFPFFLD